MHRHRQGEMYAFQHSHMHFTTNSMTKCRFPKPKKKNDNRNCNATNNFVEFFLFFLCECEFKIKYSFQCNTYLNLQSSSELESGEPPWPLGLGPRDLFPLRTLFSLFRSFSTIFLPNKRRQSYRIIHNTNLFRISYWILAEQIDLLDVEQPSCVL